MEGEPLRGIEPVARKRYGAAEREQLLEEFGCSGQEVEAFAASRRIRPATLRSWLRDRQRGQEAASGASGPGCGLSFAQVDLSGLGGLTGAGMMVEVAGGLRLEVRAAGQVAWAAALLRQLGHGAGGDGRC